MPGPFGRKAVAGIRRHIGRRLELIESLDFESSRAEKPDPFAVRQMEIDRIIAFPIGAMHPEIGSEQPIPYGRKLFIRVAEIAEGAADKENELAARPK